MQIVIKSTKGNAVTTSLLVAEKFGKRHSDVMRAISETIKQMPENECKRNFAPWQHDIVQPNGGNRIEPYYMMTRDGFSLLVMGFTGARAMAFKLEFIEAFNEMERKLAAPQLPATYLDALKALVVSEEQKQLAEAKINELEPKAEVYDTIANTCGLLSLNDAAKSLHQGRNKMVSELRKRSILDSNNIAYQRFIDQGYFEIKITPVPALNYSYRSTLVTNKGLVWLAKILK